MCQHHWRDQSTLVHRENRLPMGMSSYLSKSTFAILHSHKNRCWFWRSPVHHTFHWSRIQRFLLDFFLQTVTFFLHPQSQDPLNFGMLVGVQIPPKEFTPIRIAEEREQPQARFCEWMAKTCQCCWVFLWPSIPKEYWIPSGIDPQHFLAGCWLGSLAMAQCTSWCPTTAGPASGCVASSRAQCTGPFGALEGCFQ